MKPSALLAIAAAIAFTMGWKAAAIAQSCAGDCNGDGMVTIDELVVGVNIALGSEAMSECRALDADHDGECLIDELVVAVSNCMHACDPCPTCDADGDGLSDYKESTLYHSDPNDPDTDGDGIEDGREVQQYRTSPALADTDGDGVDDHEEILSGGRTPRMAELPQLRMELSGDPNIRLDVDYTTGNKVEEEVLTRDETNRVDTDTVATKMSIENTVQLHTETEGGTGKWPPSFAAKLTTDNKFFYGYFHDTSSSWEQQSAEAVQEKYASWEQEIVRYNSGEISVAMRVSNDSALTFKVKDLVLNAYRDDGGGHFTVIDTLVPDPTAWPEGGHLVGPGGSFTMIAGREISDAVTMKSLVKHPTGLLFEVGSYSIFKMDSTGQIEEIDYDVLGATVLQRTGTLVIDYGEGTVERYMVATNVERDATGKGKGVRLAEALSGIIGLSYGTREQIDPDTGKSTGSVVLNRVRNVSSFRDSENPAIHGFWTVAGTDPDFYEGEVRDFDATMLRPSELITLVYLRDSDGDGIYDREEYLLGTNKLVTDSDGDGLTDYEESKEGWQVAPVGKVAYKAYPDARVRDVDGDGLTDFEEKSLGTDPFLEDTDDDGTQDAYDDAPLEPACLTTLAQNLVTWWDGTYAVDPEAEDLFLAVDIWGTYAFDPPDPLDGFIVASDPSSVPRTIENSPLFLFNPDPDQNDQYISVPSDARINPTTSGFTIYTEINWLGAAVGADEGTVIAKGSDGTATYRLSVNADGSLTFALYRHVHEKRWFTTWWPWPISSWSWDDGLCEDHSSNDTRTLRSGPNTIEPHIPTKVVATYEHVSTGNSTADKDLMTLYLQGRQETPLTYEYNFAYHSGMCHSCCTRKDWSTLNLNADALRIGGGPVSGGIGRPYRGTVDDVQFFNRPLNRSEVVNGLLAFRVCRPDGSEP